MTETINYIQAVTDTDDLTLPTTFVNRFIVRVTPTTTRITFGEQAFVGAPPTHLLAVTIPTGDAQGLAMLLKGLLSRNGFWNQAEEAKAEAEARAEPKTP